MKGNTQGIPAAGPDSVTQMLSVFWVVDDAGCVLVIVGLMVEDALMISSTEDGVWTSSTRQLERLPVFSHPTC